MNAQPCVHCGRPCPWFEDLCEHCAPDQYLLTRVESSDDDRRAAFRPTLEAIWTLPVAAYGTYPKLEAI